MHDRVYELEAQGHYKLNGIFPQPQNFRIGAMYHPLNTVKSVAEQIMTWVGYT